MHFEKQIVRKNMICAIILRPKAKNIRKIYRDRSDFNL